MCIVINIHVCKQLLGDPSDYTIHIECELFDYSMRFTEFCFIIKISGF